MPDGCEVGWMTYVLRDIIHLFLEKGTSVGYKLKKLRGCSCREFRTAAAVEPTPAEC